jgi:hypothetical protein
VHRVSIVPAAELLHLDALAVVDPRLHRDVVPALALFAGQGDLDPLVIGLGSHGVSRLSVGRPEVETLVVT